MDDIDLSRPGTELFPEISARENGYNSYSDVNFNKGHDVGDPLDTGVQQAQQDAADLAVGSKEYNFKALRDEVSKMKEEREYWKGKAEAYSTQPSRQPEAQPDPYASLDWEDSRDVRKAFDSIREENSRMREEMKNAVTALNTRAERKDWDSMVSTHVPQLTNENPMFAEMIQKASNPYEAAYLLAELRAKNAQPTQQPNQPVMMQQNAERAITNANKPQTLSSIGGGGTLSASDYYASMSDEDFMKVASRNMAGI